MKLSVEIILIIIIGIIILFNACSETEYFSNVTGTTIAGADIDAIRNLNSYAKTLMQPDGTLTNPGNLNVAGNINLGNNAKGLKIEQGTGDGATFDTYNGALSSWSGLALRSTCSESNCGPLGGKPSHVFNTRNGDTFLKGNIDITGEIKFPHGWTLGVTSDGHLRIRHNGANKFAVHKDGQPMYAPNGLDVGTWVGTGGGTLNVSGNVNVVGNTKTKKLNADLVDIKPATTHYRAGVEGVGLRLGGMRISGQDNDPQLITINSEATGTSEDQWRKSTTNISVDSHKRKGY